MSEGTPNGNGGTTRDYLARIEEKADRATENSAKARAEVVELRTAILGSDLIPGDKGALGRLDAKVDALHRSIRQEKQDEQESRTAGISRRWNFLTYLIVGLIVAGASYGFSYLPR